MWICIPKYLFTLFCREKFLSQIYALFGVPFTGLKNMVAYQKWQSSGMVVDRLPFSYVCHFSRQKILFVLFNWQKHYSWKLIFLSESLIWQKLSALFVTLQVSLPWWWGLQWGDSAEVFSFTPTQKCSVATGPERWENECFCTGCCPKTRTDKRSAAQKYIFPFPK